jgi:citrate synthase
VLVAVLGAADPGRFDTRPEAVLPRARGLIRALAAALALPFDPVRAEAASAEATVAGSVAVALGVPPRPGALAAIDRALVLLADHELNASTFAARVVASTRADVYAAVLAGLSTLSGPLHGAASDRVEALLAEIPSPEDAASVIHERDRMGERVPGFGHPYYPDGDPRAPLLIDAAFEVGLREPMLRRLGALADAMEAAGRPPPNVDVGIVALSAALRMPRGAASGLFAVARCAGWVAHVLEQYQAGFLMRPRARYTPADGEGSPSEGESP